MRCDLHVHSWYSGRAELPVLEHVGRECYSDPHDVYERARSLAFSVEPLTWFEADRFSFPSGHALSSFAIGSVIALSFPLVAAPVLALAASVAASRVVLGLHWLSDVLAGALAGLVIGAAVWLALLR